MLSFPGSSSNNFAMPKLIQPRSEAFFPISSSHQAMAKDSVRFGLTHATQLVKLAPNTPLHQIHWYDVPEGLKVGTSVLNGRDYFIMLPGVKTTQKNLAKLLSHALIQHSERPYTLILAAPEHYEPHEFIKHLRDDKKMKISKYGGNGKGSVPSLFQPLYNELKPSPQSTLYVIDNRAHPISI